MAALVLAVLSTMVAAQQAAESGASSAVAEFRLGPAAATARRELVDGQVCVVVTVTNDTDSPLWWRGAGIGCVGSGIWTPPVDEEGRLRREFGSGGIGCTMERDLESQPAQLEEWKLASGASRTETLRPFWDIEEWDERADLRPQIATLVRWIYWHEVTLPRTTPPTTTMDFECPMLLVAWDRTIGLRIFVDGAEDDVSLPHFDPFDSTPFFREGPAPLHLGPLVGTAELSDGVRPAIVLKLRNPGARAVTWRVTPADEPFPFAPGESRTVRIWPFGREGAAAPLAEERWHRECASHWPVEGDASEEDWPTCTLHAVWDPRYGLTVNLEEPQVEWKPFTYGDAYSRRSAAVRVGDAWLIASALRGTPRALQVRVLPVREHGYWREEFGTMSATEEFRWSDGQEFGAPRAWREPDPPRSFAKPSEWMDWIVSPSKRTWVSVGYDAVPSDWEKMPVVEGEFWPGWEWRRVVLVPRAAPPTSTHGLMAARLRVRWVPELGLELTAESAAAE